MDDVVLRYGVAVVALLMGCGISLGALLTMKRRDQGFGPYNLRAVMLPLVVTLAALVAIAGVAEGQW